MQGAADIFGGSLFVTVELIAGVQNDIFLALHVGLFSRSQTVCLTIRTDIRGGAA